MAALSVACPAGDVSRERPGLEKRAAIDNRTLERADDGRV